MTRQKLSDAGLALLEQLEGYTPVAHHLPADRPGVVTGGYGETHVRLGETHTQAEWEARLRTRVRIIEMLVNAGLITALPQASFDALVLFTYNVGPGDPKAHPPVDGFLTSTLRRELNLGHLENAAEQFKVWNQVDGHVCPGLTHRRAVEEALFRQGMATLGVPQKAA